MTERKRVWTNPPMKVGDLVECKGFDDWRVVALHSDWAWIDRSDGSVMPMTIKWHELTVVKPFFQAGKSYVRHTGWSIVAQQNDVLERFQVTQVERNGSGLLVAFGRLTVLQHADTWVLRDEYSWNKDGWELDR